MAACAETNFRPDLTYQFVEQDEETMDSGIKTLLREEIEIQETINFSNKNFAIWSLNASINRKRLFYDIKNKFVGILLGLPWAWNA